MSNVLVIDEIGTSGRVKRMDYSNSKALAGRGLRAVNTLLTPLRTAVIMTVLLSAACSHAITLDWNNVDWPYDNNGTTGSGNQGDDVRTFSQGFDIDPDNPGIDVTISITGDTGNFRNDTSPASGYVAPADGESGIVYAPNDHNGAVGGLGATEEVLYLFLNHGSRDNDFVTVTVTFSSNYTDGVFLDSLILTDIDSTGSYEDQIRNFRGSLDGGSDVFPSITPFDGGTNVTIANEGTASATTTGDGGFDDISSTGGTVIFDFGNQGIDEFSFDYGNGAGAPNNPGNQLIGFYDIVYSPVPEPGTVVSGVALLLVAFGLWLRRKISII
ncbi:MAG: hypothetical protein AAFY98_07430 [Verrucomicrobiota bacterium]